LFDLTGSVTFCSYRLKAELVWMFFPWALTVNAFVKKTMEMNE